jgi:hypothetical protein
MENKSNHNKDVDFGYKCFVVGFIIGALSAILPQLISITFN